MLYGVGNRLDVTGGKMNSVELKALRLYLNMTQKDIAVMCGVPLITYEHCNGIDDPEGTLELM